MKERLEQSNNQEQKKIPELPRFVEKALALGRNKNLLPASVKKYRDSIRKFYCIIPKELADLTIDDFDKFTETMMNNGAENQRIANVISAMKWVIKTLRTKGIIYTDIDLDKIERPRIISKPVECLTMEETAKLQSVIMSQGINIRSARDMALIQFILDNGGRIGEVLSINREMIDWENREVRILGKGAKYRTLDFSEETKKWLEKYLSMRCDSCEALFVTQNGSSRWQQTDVGRVFRKYRELSGIKKKLTAHMLRKTHATLLLDSKEASINDVKESLGHSCLSTTTKYYIGPVIRKELKKKLNKYFEFIPRKRLDEVYEEKIKFGGER